MKRFISLMLAVLILLTSVPVGAVSGEKDYFIESNKVKLKVESIKKEEPEKEKIEEKVFKEKSYEFKIKHDYDQEIEIEAKSFDNKSGEYEFKIEDVPSDVYIGFDVDDVYKATLDRYYHRIKVYANAQNANSGEKTFKIVAYKDGKKIESCSVTLKIEFDKLNLNVENNVDTYSGFIFLTITNKGKIPVSDLSFKINNHKYFFSEETLNNYYLYQGDSVYLTIKPNIGAIASNNVENLNITLTGLGQEQNFNIPYNIKDLEINSKTVKEILADQGYEFNAEKVDDKTYGRDDFPDGVLKLSEVNKWPVEICIKSDKLEIIDDNKALTKFDVISKDIKDSIVEEKTENLSGTGNKIPLNVNENVMRFEFKFTDTEGKNYDRVLRVKKPSKELELQDNVKILDDSKTNEFAESFLGYIKLDDGNYAIELKENSKILNDIRNGVYKVSDILYFKELSNNINTSLPINIQLLNLSPNDDIKSFDADEQQVLNEMIARKNTIIVGKSNIMDMIKGDFLIENVVNSPSQLFLKYEYNIEDGLKINEQSLLRKAGEMNFNSDLGTNFNIKFNENSKASIGLNNEFEFATKAEASRRNFINTAIAKKGNNSYVYFVISELNNDFSADFKLSAEGELDDLLGKSKDKKEGFKIFGLELSGLDSPKEDKILIAAKGLAPVTKMTHFTMGEKLPVDIVLWVYAFMDIHGNVTIETSFGPHNRFATSNVGVALKTKEVDDSYIPGANNTTSRKSYGKHEFLLLNGGTRVENSLDWILKCEGDLAFDLGLGSGISVLSIFPLSLELFNRVGLEGELEFDLKTSTKDNKQNTSPSWKACGEAVGKIMMAAKGEITAAFGKGEKKDYELEAKAENELDLLTYLKKAGCFPNEKDESEKDNIKIIPNQNFFDSDQRQNDGGPIIPIGDSTGLPGSTNNDGIEQYPSMSLTSKGRQCINAKTMNWGFYLPEIDGIFEDDINLSTNFVPYSMNSFTGLKNASMYYSTLNNSALESSTNNPNSLENQAYLLNKITLPDAHKNRFEEFKYYVNDTPIGKSSLDIGGSRIYKIEDPSLLKAGKNNIVQTNTYTNPGSMVMMSDLILTLPLSMDTKIPTIGGNPIVDIRPPYVDFSIGRDSVKFKNKYPGLINSEHNAEVNVFNLGTKESKANLLLYKNKDGKKYLLSSTSAYIKPLSNEVFNVDFVYEDGCFYNFEVKTEDNDVEINDNYARINLPSLKESDIYPNIWIKSIDPLTVEAYSSYGVPIKEIKLFEGENQILSKTIEKQSQNNVYSLEESEKLKFKNDSTYRIEVYDKFGTKGVRSFGRGDNLIKINPNETIVGDTSYTYVRDQNLKNHYPRIQDNEIIFYRDGKDDVLTGYLGFNNKMYYLYKEKQDKDLNKDNLNKIVLKYPDGVSNLQTVISVKDSPGYYGNSRTNLKFIDDIIYLAKGEYSIYFGYDYKGISYQEIVEFDSSKKNEIVLEPNANIKKFNVNFNGPNCFDYFSNIGNTSSKGKNALFDVSKYKGDNLYLTLYENQIRKNQEPTSIRFTKNISKYIEENRNKIDINIGKIDLTLQEKCKLDKYGLHVPVDNINFDGDMEFENFRGIPVIIEDSITGQKKETTGSYNEYSKTLSVSTSNIEIKDGDYLYIKYKPCNKDESNDDSNSELKFSYKEKEDVTPVVASISKNSNKEVKLNDSYLKGYPDNTIRPENNITRAEAAVLIAKLEAIYNNANTNEGVFSDIESDKWYSSSIYSLAEKGVMSGYPDGSFKPKKSITRAEFVQIMSKLDEKNDAKAPYNDIKDHWALSAINQAFGNKRISGYEDGSFRPNNSITRAEAVSILNRKYNRYADANSFKSDTDGNILKFTDLYKDKWYYYEIVAATNSYEYRDRGDGNANGRNGQDWIKIAN